MKQVIVRAGERTRLFGSFSNSVPATYRFSAEPLVEGEGVSGRVEVKGSTWLFPKPASTQELQAENSVTKGAWDTLYSVYVTPGSDVRITLTSAPVSQLWLIITLAITALAVISSLVPYLMKN